MSREVLSGGQARALWILNMISMQWLRLCGLESVHVGYDVGHASAMSDTYSAV